MHKGMAIASLLLFLTGCIAAPEKGARFPGITEARPGYSVLYIYRPYEYVGGFVWPEVFINEVKTVGLVNESYTCVQIRPGRYRIHTEKCYPLSTIGNIRGEISIESGRVYFLLLDRKFEWHGVWAARPYERVYERWTMMNEEEGLSEIRRLRYVKPYVETIEVGLEPASAKEENKG